MEYLNKIEIKGIVGIIGRQRIADQEHANISVMTEYANEDVTETTWFNVSAWDVPAGIKKGSKVHVIGRIRNRWYTGGDGIDRLSSEVIASSVEELVEE